MPETKSVSIGIDIGTTYSSMAYAAIKVTNGVPVAVPRSATDPTSSRLERQFIPSLVCAYVEKGQLKWAVGQEAERMSQKHKNKAHLYRAFKLFLGTSLPEKDKNIVLDGIPVKTDAVELAKKIVSYMRDLAFGPSGELEGFAVNSITVSTPALWTEDRKSEVEGIVRSVFPESAVQSLEEPISALYHQINSANHLLSGPEKNVLVVDYGGGTCDVAVVRIKRNAERLQAESKNVAEVIGRGSLERGGEIIDRKIARFIDAKLKKQGVTLSSQELLKEAEALKITFSNQIRDNRIYPYGEIREPFKMKYESQHLSGKNKSIQMTEDSFAKLLDEELNRIAEPIVEALNNASDLIEKPLTHKDIKFVFLAGGSTLLPFVKDKIHSFFLEKDTSVSVGEPEPRFAIAYGNALHAYHTYTRTGFGIGVSLQESIWLKVLGGFGSRIASKGVTLPFEHTETFLLVERTDTIEVELYIGRNLLVKNDTRISESIKLQLTKPIRPFTRLKAYIFIHESGSIDFELSRVGYPQDVVKIKKRVPVRNDLDEMAARIGMNFLKEDL